MNDAISELAGRRMTSATQLRLMTSSPAHYRAMLFRAFGFRSVWQEVCRNRIMKRKPLRQRIRASKRLVQSSLGSLSQ